MFFVNAVNITDGLDGLAALVSLLPLILLCLISSNPFLFAFIGSLSAFLVFNLKPAKYFMKGKGDALMGIGFGEGANRAVDAARQAISNPLLENASITGAKNVLVNLCGSENLTLQEYEDVVELITQNCDENALIIAGQAFNPELGDRIKVTVVATGFDRKDEVIGSEADTISASKRFAIPTGVGTPVPPVQAAFTQAKPAPAEESKKETQGPQGTQPQTGTIQINRWQDLQKQIGKGNQGLGNDFTIPAVLRYGQHESIARKEIVG